MNGLIAWMARNSVAANLLMLFIIFAGISSLFTIPVKVFPDVSLDIVTVRVDYLGASPTEIESSIIEPIEQAIEGIQDIKEVNATASENFANIIIQLNSGAPATQRLDDIKAAIDRIPILPESSEKPIVSLATNRSRVMEIVLSGDAPERAMKELAYKVKDDLEATRAVSIIEVAGTRPYEVSIEVPNDKLRALGMSLVDVANVVRRESLEMPAGELDTPSQEVVLRTLGRNYVARDYQDIVLKADKAGNKLRLGDVARVDDGFRDVKTQSLRDGRPAVMVDVFSVGDEQLLDVTDAVYKYVDQKLKPSLPKGIDVAIFRDQSVELHARLNLLIKNALMGLVLVVATLMIFLNLRLAFWASVGIAISFLGAFALMDVFGVAVSMISTIGFILALGIVVDDAIVVGENVHVYREKGYSAEEAAIIGTQRIAIPIIFAVATTIVGFGALLTLPGTIGKLLGALPAVVISVLLISLVEVLLILPNHLASEKHSNFFSRFHSPRWWTRLTDGASDGMTRFIEGPLDKAVRFVIQHPWSAVTAGISLILISVGIIVAGFVKVTFTPEIEGNYVIATLELPTGATFDQTKEIVSRIEAAANEAAEEFQPRMRDQNIPVLKAVQTTLGRQDAGGERPDGGGGEVAATQSNLASITVEVQDPVLRNFATVDFERAWRKATGRLAGIKRLNFSSNLLSFGDPISVELSANSPVVLDKAIQELEADLTSINGVFDVKNDRDQGKREFKFELKPVARAYGVDLQSLAQEVRAAFFGVEALRVQRGREELRVYVRLPEDERDAVSDLNAYRVKTPQGFIPLGSLVTVTEGTSPTAIKRRNGRRIVTVSANVNTDIITPDEVNSFVRDNLLDQMKQELPGLDYGFAGEQQERQDTLPTLLRNFGFALLAIYALLAVVFRSYITPVIIMTSIPFGIIGAIFGHLMFGMNITIVSFFGIVGLSGVIVNGGLVMIDFMHEAKAQNASHADAILYAAKGRFRPIFLTALTTFVGVTPLILEQSIQAQFLIPVAISLGFGVLFGTVIQMLMIPALLALIEPKSKPVEPQRTSVPRVPLAGE